MKTVLSKLMLCLEAESVDVRLQSLKTLSSLLDSNIGPVQGLVVCSDRTDPVITQLTTKLMACLSIREQESAVRKFAADCLGKMGPIDPGKLELVVNLAGDNDDICTRNKK